MIVGAGIEYKDFDKYEKGRLILTVENRGWIEPWREELQIAVWYFPFDKDKYKSLLPIKAGTIWLETFLKERKAVARTGISLIDDFKPLEEGIDLLISDIQDILGEGWICIENNPNLAWKR